MLCTLPILTHCYPQLSNRVALDHQARQVIAHLAVRVSLIFDALFFAFAVSTPF